MPEDPSSTPSTPPNKGDPPTRKVLTGVSGEDNSSQSQFRQRFSVNRSITSMDAPTPGIKRSSTEAPIRRRSSGFSEYSLNEARRTFQSSTDDLLLPKPSANGFQSSHDSSPWHSAPLAFALLPAIGGMLFKNGSSVITDVTLLGLAAIFLNWSVRLPW